MVFGEIVSLLLSETIISTHTAVAASPDPISEWNYTGYKEESFWNDYQRSWGAPGNILSEACWYYPDKNGWHRASRQSCIKRKSM